MSNLLKKLIKQNNGQIDWNKILQEMRRRQELEKLQNPQPPIVDLTEKSTKHSTPFKILQEIYLSKPEVFVAMFKTVKEHNKQSSLNE